MKKKKRAPNKHEYSVIAIGLCVLLIVLVGWYQLYTMNEHLNQQSEPTTTAVGLIFETRRESNTGQYEIHFVNSGSLPITVTIYDRVNNSQLEFQTEMYRFGNWSPNDTYFTLVSSVAGSSGCRGLEIYQTDGANRIFDSSGCDFNFGGNYGMSSWQSDTEFTLYTTSSGQRTYYDAQIIDDDVYITRTEDD